MHPRPLQRSDARTTLRRSALAVTAAMLLVACGSDAAQDSEPAAAEADAPATPDDTGQDDAGTPGSSLLTGVVPTVSGSQVDLAAFEGQDVLVWVWAPW